MPVVRTYPVAEVEARPIPNAALGVPAAGDTNLFGGNQARQQLVAADEIGQASASLENIATREFKIANDTKVEGDLNSFIDQKQKAVSAFVQLKGQDAIQGAEVATSNLLKIKQGLLDSAKNPYQRDLLSRRLDAQLRDATGTIDAHVANQSTAWQKDTLAARGALIDRDGVMKRDDPDAIDGQLQAKASIGQERARLEHGAAPDSEIAKVYAADEQSKYLKGVLQAKIDDGNKRAALALYEKYGTILKRDAGVSAAMKGVRTDIDGENAANRAFSTVGLPQIRSGETGDIMQKRQEMTGRLLQAGFSAVVAPALAANFEHESGFRSSAVNPKDGSDGSDSIGLGQWNGPRAKALVQFAKGKGLDPGSADAQIGYMQAELSGEVPFTVSGIKPDLKARLDAAKTPGEAVALLSREYFKPRAASEADSRAQTAGSIPVPGAIYKGDLKAGYEQAAALIQNDGSLSPEVRANALATINKTATQVTSYQTSALKALTDEANSYRAVSYLSPNGPDPTRLAAYADKAASLGDQQLATRYRMLAAIAPSLKNGLQSLPADQLKMLKSLEEGLPKQLLEGVESGRGDAATAAQHQYDLLKKRVDNNLPVAPDDIKKVAQGFADLGKGEKAQEVAEWGGGVLQAGQALKLPPDQQAQVLQELKAIADKGTLTGQQVVLADELRKGMAQQQAAITADGLTGGAGALGMTVPPLNLDDPHSVAQRLQLAGQINAARPDAKAILATAPEVQGWRQMLDTANPMQQAQLMQKIAAATPAAMMPQVAAALAGKDATPVSRGYAAALSFFANHAPESQSIAREILDGVQRRKDMGDSARKLTAGSDAVQSAIQTKIGNAFVDVGRKVPSVIVDAAEAIYTSRMIRAGRGGEKLDGDMLNSALDAVVGKTITRNGQMLLPPKGVDSYQFDRAVRSLSDGDVADFRTLNGSPVTADKIARYGILTNAGGEGQFFVQMPDPAQDNRPAYVQRPDGRPYVLELGPLLERAQRFPGYQVETPNSARDDRRRAPASPTADAQP